MHIAHILKSSALAALVVLATAGASFAAIGWMEDDAVVRHKPLHFAKTVNWVAEGQKVNVVASQKGWYKIKIPGHDGWVKKSLVSFHGPVGDWGYGYGWNDRWGHGWGYGPSGAFCVSGQTARICIGGY